MKYQRVIEHLIKHCGNLNPKERLLILCDVSTQDIAEVFLTYAKTLVSHPLQANLLVLPIAAFHGAEPDEIISAEMKKADLIMSLCKMSLAHSQARVEAGKCGARFLSMPLYTWELLDDPALSVDFQAQYSIVKKVSEAFTQGSRVEVKTKAGTKILLDIVGRVGNCCPGFVTKPGDLGSPPDIEANVSPVETFSIGKVVIDGSITCPELGLLSNPVVLTVSNGGITEIESENASYVEILNKMLGPVGSKRRVLAECGVGLNPDAKLTGTMLTDEGAYGCMHFGFGANHTVGGQNKTDFHLDFVFKEATLIVDGKMILNNGELCDEFCEQECDLSRA